jgi:putative peptidoglycan lipid II flippase
MSGRDGSLKPGSVGRSSAVLVSGVAGAQAVGIVRELYLAAQVGLSGDLDAMLIAIGLTTLAAGVLTGGAGTALVPIYLEAQARSGQADARRLAGTVVTAIGVAGLGLAVVVALVSPVLISIGGPGLSPDDHERAIGYLRLLTPVLFLNIVATMYRSICQAEGRFGAIAQSTVVGPAVTVVTMLAIWPSFHLGALAIGSVTGALASVGWLVVALARASALPSLGVRRDPRIRDWLRHAGPLTVSGAILELRGLVDRAVASLLGPGSVSALRYATVLIQPLSQIGPSWASVIYPKLVQLTIGPDGGSLAAWADKTMRSALALFIPIAALTAAVGPLAAYVAYGRGAFTPEDLALTGATLAAYAPIVVTLMLLPVLVGAHNARRRGRLMLQGGILNVILNIVLDVVLGLMFGAPGIALSTSLAEVVVVAVFIRALASSGDSFDVRPLLRTGLVSLIAIAPFALVAARLVWTGFGTSGTLVGAVVLALIGLIGVGGYVIVASGLGLEPVRDAVRSTLGRLAGFRRSTGRS